MIGWSPLYSRKRWRYFSCTTPHKKENTEAMNSISSCCSTKTMPCIKTTQTMSLQRRVTYCRWIRNTSNRCPRFGESSERLKIYSAQLTTPRTWSTMNEIKVSHLGYIFGRISIMRRSSSALQTPTQTKHGGQLKGDVKFPSLSSMWVYNFAAIACYLLAKVLRLYLVS